MKKKQAKKQIKNIPMCFQITTAMHNKIKKIMKKLKVNQSEAIRICVESFQG
jgi:hypothetical protein